MKDEACFAIVNIQVYGYILAKSSNRPPAFH